SSLVGSEMCIRDRGTLDHLTGQLTAFGEFIQRVKI
ncbi:hypothetical protein ACX3VG_27520, partial [Escherichia coli]